ncbi:MAG: serine/threonine protein kinase [Myxococcaceae bacterium]|nr:serine/threonine protein kinase [Myxococcaceae bacterium]
MGSRTTDATRLGPYTLGRRIGRGGMGVVYEATADDGRRVAVKQLAASEDGASGVNVQRFLDEARLGAQLEHPNIVRTLEGGVEGGHAWLAMERLSGAPLSQAFRVSGEGLKLELALGIAVQVLDALEYLHAQKNVIHRDVKPSNVFITDDGTVKLIDFGIAVAESLDATATATGAVRGSFPFVSPEYLRGEPLDGRADLFSFGLVLHELLTGARVFDQGNQAAVVSAILFGVIAPVRASRPEVPEALDVELMMVLSREKGGRHADARTFREALVAAAGVVPASRGEIAEWLKGAVAERAQETGAPVPVVVEAPGPVSAAPRSRAPLFVVGGVLVVGASLGGGFMLARLSGDAPAPVVVAPVVVAPVVSPPPPPAVQAEPEPAPVAAPVQRPAKRASGFLTVDAQPTWANVSIDGKLIGPTPLYKRVVSAGSHRVDAVTADGRKKSKTVSVTKDQEARLLFEW